MVIRLLTVAVTSALLAGYSRADRRDLLKDLFSGKPRAAEPATPCAGDTQTAALLHGQEVDIWLDAGYVGVEKREDMQAALKAHNQTVRWHVAKRRKSIEKLADGWQKSLAQAYEKLKAQTRALVEHPFHVIKNIFKHKKARYKGLAKNDAQLNTLFALSNLYMMRGKLCPSQA